MDIRTIIDALTAAGYSCHTGKHGRFFNVRTGRGNYLTVRKDGKITLLCILPRGRHSEFGMCTPVTAYGLYSWANPANSRRDCLYERNWFFDYDQDAHDALVRVVGEFATKVASMNVY